MITSVGRAALCTVEATVPRFAPMSRVLLAGTAAAVLFAGTLAVAGPVRAAPSISGTPTVTAPDPLVRGGAPQSGTIVLQATEGATFDLDIAAPDLVAAFQFCTADAITVICVVAPDGVVTVGHNLDPTPDQAVTVTISFSLSAPITLGLASVEGVDGVSAVRTVQVTATPTDGTGGVIAINTDTTTIVGNPTTEAEVRLVTSTVPAAPASVSVGSTIVYRASLTRSGNVAQLTNASVTLVPDAASGTVVAGTNPQTASFAIGETTKQLDFAVSVPTGTAAPATASYHFAVTWDPIGIDGAPSDTETGTALSFTIIAASTGGSQSASPSSSQSASPSSSQSAAPDASQVGGGTAAPSLSQTAMPTIASTAVGGVLGGTPAPSPAALPDTANGFAPVELAGLATVLGVLWLMSANALAFARRRHGA